MEHFILEGITDYGVSLLYIIERTHPGIQVRSFYVPYFHRYFRSNLACNLWPGQNGWVFIDLGTRSVRKLKTKALNQNTQNSLESENCHKGGPISYFFPNVL